MDTLHRAYHPVRMALNRVGERHVERKQVVLAHALVKRQQTCGARAHAHGALRHKFALFQVKELGLTLEVLLDGRNRALQVCRVQLVRHHLEHSDHALRGEARIVGLGAHALCKTVDKRWDELRGARRQW